jgi:hypothetical protein
MLKYRQFPMNLFTGSEQTMQRLYAALAATAPK